MNSELHKHTVKPKGSLNRMRIRSRRPAEMSSAGAYSDPEFNSEIHVWSSSLPQSDRNPKASFEAGQAASWIKVQGDYGLRWDSRQVSIRDAFRHRCPPGPAFLEHSASDLTQLRCRCLQNKRRLQEHTLRLSTPFPPKIRTSGGRGRSWHYDAIHLVSITRFPLSRFSPGAGLLRNPFVHR